MARKVSPKPAPSPSPKPLNRRGQQINSTKVASSNEKLKATTSFSSCTSSRSNLKLTINLKKLSEDVDASTNQFLVDLAATGGKKGNLKSSQMINATSQFIQASRMCTRSMTRAKMFRKPVRPDAPSANVSLKLKLNTKSVDAQGDNGLVIATAESSNSTHHKRQHSSSHSLQAGIAGPSSGDSSSASLAVKLSNSLLTQLTFYGDANDVVSESQSSPHDSLQLVNNGASTSLTRGAGGKAMPKLFRDDEPRVGKPISCKSSIHFHFSLVSPALRRHHWPPFAYARILKHTSSPYLRADGATCTRSPFQYCECMQI